MEEIESLCLRRVISLEYLGFPAGLQGLQCTWSLLCCLCGELPSHPDAKAVEDTEESSPIVSSLP